MKKVLGKDISKPYVVRRIEKWLQSADVSRKRPFKVCIVAKNRRKLRDLTHKYWVDNDYREGSEKRCGYVGFVYFDKLDLAIKMRNKLYNDKTCYVFLQDDRNLLNG